MRMKIVSKTGTVVFSATARTKRGLNKWQRDMRDRVRKMVNEEVDDQDIINFVERERQKLIEKAFKKFPRGFAFWSPTMQRMWMRENMIEEEST